VGGGTRGGDDRWVVTVAEGAAAANVSVTMARHDLEDIPRHPVPDGYAIRPFAPGDAAAWVEIQGAADAYNEITPALFRREFGDDPGEQARRILMLTAPDGAAVGTAAAWYVDARVGRVHWVAIHPSHQGRGLAKPLLGRVCLALRDLGHERAVLSTSTARIPAIALYLDFGFVPAVERPEDEAAWAELLGRVPALARRLRRA
jgi:GNAT superfamily N-acetyltransferase